MRRAQRGNVEMEMHVDFNYFLSKPIHSFTRRPDIPKILHVFVILKEHTNTMILT